MAFVPNRPAQSYQTANQSAYIGVSGANQANEYLRYKEELDRQRKEREEAERKAKAGWWKRALVNGVGGAIAGIPGGPGGMAAGLAAGFGTSALGDAAGLNAASYGMGGAQLGGVAGQAFRNWAAQRNQGASGASGGSGYSAPSTPSLGGYQLSRPSYDPSSSFNFDTDIDYRSYYPGF